MADEKIIIEVEYDTGEAQKNINNLDKEINDLTKSNEILKNTIRDSRKDLSKTDTELKKENKSRQDLNKTVVDGTKKLQKNSDRIKAARKERNNSIKTIKGEESAFDKLTNAVKKGNEQRQSQIDKMEQMPGAAGGVIGGIKGIIKASLAFIATPVGAVLAAIVGVLALLKKAFNRNEAAQNRLRVITSKLSGVFNFLLKALQPLVEFLIDKVADAFEFVSETADKAIGLLQKGLKLLGLDKAAKQVGDFQKKMEETVEITEELTKAQNELTKAQRNARLIQLQFQKDAEIQRQIRDDESKSIRERIDANEKLGKVLDKQLQEELRIANLALKVADLRIKAEGEFAETLDQRAEALTEIADIQERITGQESEQLVNVNALNKELLEERLEDDKEFNKILEEQHKSQHDRRIEELKKQKEEEQEINEEIFTKEEEERFRRFGEQLEKDKEQKRNLLDITKDYLDQELQLLELNVDERFGILNRFTNSALELAQKKADGEKITLEDGAVIAKGISSDVLNFRIARLEDEKQAVIATLDANAENVKGNAELTEFLEKLKAKKVAEIQQKQFRADKTRALIEAAINTALAVIKITAQTGIGAVVAVPIAAALLGAQVALIASKKPPPIPSFKHGGELKNGMFSGQRHSQGGVNLRDDSGRVLANVEKGERFFVVNRKDSARMNALSDINSGSGRAFAKRGRLQDGGEVDTTTEVNKAIQNTKIVVHVEDIKTGLTERENVINAGVV